MANDSHATIDGVVLAARRGKGQPGQADGGTYDVITDSANPSEIGLAATAANVASGKGGRLG